MEHIFVFISYFRIEVEKDIVLEAEQQLVVVLNVLLHKRKRRVQPPVNSTANQSELACGQKYQPLCKCQV